MDWTPSSTRPVELALVSSEPAGSALPCRLAKGLAAPARAAKSLLATLLTDAQLVFDGLSSLVFNEARVEMKSLRAFYVQAKFMVKSFFFLLCFPQI